MKVVNLQGILMDNKEFICNGKSLFLTQEEIDKFVRVIYDREKEGK